MYSSGKKETQLLVAYAATISFLTASFFVCSRAALAAMLRVLWKLRVVEASGERPYIKPCHTLQLNTISGELVT